MAWEETQTTDVPGQPVWASRLTSGTPVKLSDDGSNPHPGNGIVAWIEAGTALRVATTDGMSQAELSPGPVSIIARLDVDERRVVWAEDNPDGTVEVMIADVGD